MARISFGEDLVFQDQIPPVVPAPAAGPLARHAARRPLRRPGLLTRLLAALALTLAAPLAPGASAQAPAPAQAEVDAAPAETERVAGWHYEIAGEVEAIADELEADVGKAIEYAKAQDRREGQRWVRTWAPAMRARLARLSARAPAAPKLDETKLSPDDFDNLPEVAARFRRLPEGTSALARGAAQAGEALIAEVERAIGGDAASAARLFRHSTAMIVVEKQAHNASLAVDLADAPDDHPEAAVLESTVAANQALIGLWQGLYAETVDPAAIRARVAPFAQVMRTKADQMERFAQSWLEGMRKEPPPPGKEEYGRRLTAAMQTYPQRAALERRSAAAVDEVLAAVERDPAPGSDVVDQALGRLYDRVDEASEMDGRRTALVNGEPAPAASSAAEPSTADLDAALAEMARISQWHMSLSLEVVAALTALGEGAQQALNYGADATRRAEGRRWVAGWAASERQRLAQLRARVAAAPRVDEAKLAAVLVDNPEMIEAYRGVPAATADVVAAASQQGEAVIADAVLAAGGDAAAIARLPRRTAVLSVVTLQSENAQLAAVIGGMPRGHPQRPLSEAAMASNNAMIELLNAAAPEGPRAVDLTAVGARVRQHLGVIRTKTGEIETAAAATLADMRANPPPAGDAALDDQHRRTIEAFETYRESAQAERRVADALEAMLRALPRDASGFPALQAAHERVRETIRPRIELHQKRMRLLTPA